MRISLSILILLLIHASTLTAEHNNDRVKREERKQAKTSEVATYPDGGFLIEGVSSKDTFKIVDFLKQEGFEVIGADEGTPLFVYSQISKKRFRKKLLKQGLNVEVIREAKESDVDWRNDLGLIIRDRKAKWKRKHASSENAGSEALEGPLK